MQEQDVDEKTSGGREGEATVQITHAKHNGIKDLMAQKTMWKEEGKAVNQYLKGDFAHLKKKASSVFTVRKGSWSWWLIKEPKMS